jgi:hypothetical protein
MVLLLGCAYAEDSASVPQLVKFSGTISGSPAGSVSVIFALYKDQTGGAPLWQEVQNLAVDASGHYTSLLGARSAAGIPVEVFSTGEARWLGVQAERQPEQPRVLLVSVPYALKASDAETLGGLPASAFLRASAAPPASTTPANYVNTAAVNAAARSAVAAAIAVNNPTLGYVPYFYDAGGDLQNSSIFQATTGNVGIGTTNPAALLSLVGTNPSMRIENYSNTPGDSPNFNFYTGRGTATTPLATQGGDNLGQFASAGYNGAAFPGSKVKVTFLSTENWTATANGTAMTFATTTNGTTSRTERMRIDNTGNVGIGTTTPVVPLEVYSANNADKGVVAAVSTVTSGTPIGLDAEMSGPYATGLQLNFHGPLTSSGYMIDAENYGVSSFTVDGSANISASGGLSASGVIQSTSGGFKFPDGSTQTKAALSGTVGIANGGTGATTAASARAALGAAASGANGDITSLAAMTTPLSVAQGGTGSATKNFVDLSSSQSIAGTKTFSGSVAAGTAVTSPKYCIAASCITSWPSGGGSITLPVTWSSAAIAPAGVLNVTNTTNGPAMPQNGPPNFASVPVSIVGTASGTGTTSGVLGQATGNQGFGVVGYTSTSNNPSVVAWNAVTGFAANGSNGDWPYGLVALLSNAGGTTINAQATASTAPTCTQQNQDYCQPTIGVKSSVKAGTGQATAFEGDLSSPSATGLSLNFEVAPTSGSMISANVNCAGSGSCKYFNVDGYGNISASGNLTVGGSISKGGGTFKIDHPLDPANKYLYHSFVESPDMKNIYDGIVTLDKRGKAVVQLPEYFGALNQDFRYQLTAVGAPGPNLYIASEIAGNKFTIAGGKPGAKVSWLVTGIRHDAYADAHRVVVEEAKPDNERGTYLHPELFNNRRYTAGSK